MESSCKLESKIKRNCDDTESTSSKRKCSRIDKGSMMKTTHRDHKFSEHVAKKLFEMQKSGESCDYELKTEEGGTFKVHKWVLSAVSPFFAKLLDKDMRFSEQNSDTFLVRRISTSTLETIIEFMYTGETKISTDNAKETVDIALFLNLYSLAEHGCKMLAKVVNEENCLEWVKYSETCLHYGEELTKKCLELNCKKFNDFINLPDFLELSSDTIKLLVLRERTSYTEENLFLAVKKWITHDLEERKQFAKTLFDSIHFKGFSSKFASQHIFNDNQLLKADGFKDKLISVLHNNWMRTESNLMEEAKLLGLFQNYVYSYDYREEKFCGFIAKINDNRNSFGITTIGKENILICGGRKNGKEVNICSNYSMEDKDWKYLLPMNREMCPKLITLGDEVYAFENYSKSIDIFNFYKPVWYTARNRIKFPEQQFSLCRSHNSIYYINSNIVERVDSRQLICDILYYEDLDHNVFYDGIIRKNISSSEMNGNFIYGFTTNDIRTFDVRNKKWLSTTKSYEVGFNSKPFTCIFDNKIHVFNEDGDELLIYNLSDLSFYDHKIIDVKSHGGLQSIFTL